MSAKNLFVYLCVAARGGFRREGRECVESACPAQLPSLSVTGEQIVERPGERGAVAGFHQDACLVVLNHIAESARVEGNDRSLAEQSFDGDQAEALVDGGNYDRRGALVD